MSEAAGQIIPTAPTATQPASATVLIVDDEPLGRETVGAQLFGQGYQLAFAADGADALQQALVLQPDLILLDIMMPGMDGFMGTIETWWMPKHDAKPALDMHSGPC